MSKPTIKPLRREQGTRKKMKVVIKKIEELKDYPEIPDKLKQFNEHEMATITELMKEHGFSRPIIINRRDEIISGYNTILAAKRLGKEEIPCLIIGYPEAPIDEKEWDDTAEGDDPNVGNI